MTKLSVLFLVACTVCLVDQSVGLNYFIQTNLGAPQLLGYPYMQPIPAVWQKDCDKSKEGNESSSSESSSSESNESGSSESSESSESSSSEESKESGESGESKESGESSESGESKESKESKESEEGSSSSSSESNESSEESEEKNKEEKKKEPKSLFPPRTYDFPPSSKVQKIVYSPVSYLPYRSTYVLQPSAVPYPQKSAYQYVSVPAAQTVVNGYTSPIMGRSRWMDSPITRIVYSPSSLSYPVSSKSILAPGASIYSRSWGSPLGYFKK